MLSAETLEKIYDKVENKENTYIKKPYPVIVERKQEAFVVKHDMADGGYLKGKPGDYIIQSIIDSKYVYPIDYEIFNESYIPYIDFLRERYGIWDEPFEEEAYSLPTEKANIFSKIYSFLKKIFAKEEKYEKDNI